jgi:release factor glutamine methyltransferase
MAADKRQWKIIDILNTTSAYFDRKQLSDPRLNAERLLAHLLQMDRIQLYLQFERILKDEEVARYRELVERRIRHEPLQYILGQAEFMGFTFEVNPAVLIPRPETEILVERILALKDKILQPEITIWDIGTGCGCIAIALARLWPGSRIIASDISAESLHVAQKNAQRNQVEDRILFMQHDILRETPLPADTIDIVVSNPPYISSGELSGLAEEIREHEPETALTDHADGLSFYRRIFELLAGKPQVKYILCELSGLNQDSIIYLAKQFKNKYINTYTDYNHITRVLEITL